MNASTLPLPFGGEVGEVSPVRLLDELHRRGAQVEASGGNLAIDAPRGAIADLLPDLAHFKPALLELLADDDLARQRVRPDLARRMDADFDDDDVVELGRLLLKLDAGEEIE